MFCQPDLFRGEAGTLLQNGAEAVCAGKLQHVCLSRTIPAQMRYKVLPSLCPQPSGLSYASMLEPEIEPNCAQEVSIGVIVFGGNNA